MANIQPAATNPITDQNRAYVLAQLQAQRAAQLAQALTEQGDAPIQYDQRGPVSWTQGLAKMLDAYAGKKMTDKAIDQQADVRAMGAQLMGQAYGLPTAGATPPAGAAAAPELDLPPDTAAGFTPPAGRAAAAVQPSPAALANALQGGNPTPINPYGAPPMVAMAAAQGDPAAKAMLDTFLKGKELTPEQRNSQDPVIGASVRSNLQTQNMTPAQKLANALQGAQPGSPMAAALQAGLDKETYIAPVETKPGSAMIDPLTHKPILFAPKTADGIGLDFTNPLAPTAHQVPGYAKANAAIQGAEQGAKQANTIFTNVAGPDGKAVTDFGGRVAGMVGADPTIQTARTNQQNDLAAKWKPLNEAVANAQSVNSRLDTIKDLALRASTGQFADRMQFMNSLLAMAGSEKANDANTAKVLLDKNANQIIAQLGQGGLATDAARAILTSAYPNSHMPREAIMEASDNLMAANKMQVAKAGLLQQHYLANDPASYQRAESAFNAAADPRIFQWKAMASNPQEQAAFAKKLMAQDPAIVDKIHQLDQMGVLK